MKSCFWRSLESGGRDLNCLHSSQTKFGVHGLFRTTSSLKCAIVFLRKATKFFTLSWIASNKENISQHPTFEVHPSKCQQHTRFPSRLIYLFIRCIKMVLKVRNCSVGLLSFFKKSLFHRVGPYPSKTRRRSLCPLFKHR